MAPPFCSKLLLLRRLSRALKPPSPPSSLRRSHLSSSSPSLYLREASKHGSSAPFVAPSRNICSRPSPLDDGAGSQGPAPMDYRGVLQEDEYHKLADSTMHDLLEKIEVYGDSIDIEGFDIDSGNQVLTVKLGSLGTYVLNKQTPNRQIWMSSPVSGPSRFDWDRNSQAWIYRRTKANLVQVLETELEQLCGVPITLS